jgi:hypothetical protein
MRGANSIIEGRRVAAVAARAARAPLTTAKGEFVGYIPTNSPLVLARSADAPGTAASGGTPSPR